MKVFELIVISIDGDGDVTVKGWACYEFVAAMQRGEFEGCSFLANLPSNPDPQYWPRNEGDHSTVLVIKDGSVVRPQRTGWSI